jgi:hypothetical protein
VSFGAIDQFKFPRGESLQPPASQSLGGASASSNDERLPRLKGNTEGIQVGPERDVFQKRNVSPSNPVGTAVNQTVQKTGGASSWLHTLKSMLPTKGGPMKVEKPQNTGFTPLNDAGKKLPNESVQPRSGANTAFAETLAGKIHKPTANLFSGANVNPVKKSEPSGLASMLLSMASLGSLASMVAGPAALVAKPGLLNSVASTLPSHLP